MQYTQIDAFLQESPFSINGPIHRKHVCACMLTRFSRVQLFETTGNTLTLKGHVSWLLLSQAHSLKNCFSLSQSEKLAKDLKIHNVTQIYLLE